MLHSTSVQSTRAAGATHQAEEASQVHTPNAFVQQGWLCPAHLSPDAVPILLQLGQLARPPPLRLRHGQATEQLIMCSAEGKEQGGSALASPCGVGQHSTTTQYSTLVRFSPAHLLLQGQEQAL